MTSVAVVVGAGALVVAVAVVVGMVVVETEVFIASCSSWLCDGTGDDDVSLV